MALDSISSSIRSTLTKVEVLEDDEGVSSSSGSSSECSEAGAGEASAVSVPDADAEVLTAAGGIEDRFVSARDDVGRREVERVLRRVDWAGVSKAVVLLVGCKDVFRVLRVVGGIGWVVLGRSRVESGELVR